MSLREIHFNGIKERSIKDFFEHHFNRGGFHIESYDSGSLWECKSLNMRIVYPYTYSLMLKRHRIDINMPEIIALGSSRISYTIWKSVMWPKGKPPRVFF